jgi:hypothetical protein
MVHNIDRQGEIDLTGEVTNLKVLLGADPRLDSPGELGPGCSFFESCDALGVGVDRNDPSFRSHQLGHAETVITGPTANVKNGHTRLNIASKHSPGSLYQMSQGLT